MIHTVYRPTNFDEFLGNEEIKKNLQNMLENQQKMPHSFLFSGNNGCGKTTLARIMAKELGGSEFSIREINGSNDNGVDIAREIEQLARTRPLDGTVNVMILDEVHMTTKNFQNSLLKILEEPPEFTYFFLCTTNPEKLLNPVKSRCTHFTIKNPSTPELAKLLKNIAKKQNKTISNLVVRKIIDEMEGIPRNCLVSLEIALNAESEEEALIAITNSSMMELENVIELCRAILKKESWARKTEIIKGISDEPETVRRTILGYFSTVLLGTDVSKHKIAYLCLDIFANNYFDCGKSGLIKNTFEIHNEEF